MNQLDSVVPPARAEVRFAEYPAPAVVASAVLAVWRFQVPGDVVFTEPFSIWPDASASIVLPGRGFVPPVISGPRDKPGEVPVNSGDETWGVKWWPDCAASALRVEARALAGRITNAPVDVCAELQPVRDAIRAQAPAEQIRDALWSWAERRVMQMAPIDALVRAATYELVSSRGAMAINTLAEKLGSTQRTLARHFADRVGLSPKFFARICRFHYALSRFESQPHTSVAEHANGAGYADEPHLFREFRTLAGLGPREISRRLAAIDHDPV